jgi:hypothetical protein
MNATNELITGLFDELMPSAKSALVIPAQIITVVALVFQVFSGLTDSSAMEKLKDNWLKTVVPILIVAFLVFNYGTFFDYLYETFDSVDKATMHLSDESAQQLSMLRDKKADIANQQRNVSEGKWDTIADNTPISWIVDKVDQGFELLWHTIIELIYIAIYILYKLLSFLNIYFLCMFGPIQVALYFTPWYKGALVSWIGKLITALMWMPILNIVKMVVEKIQIYFIKVDIAQLNSSDGITTGHDDWLEYVAMVVGIFMFSQVPSFASFILESSGIGGENGIFKNVIASTSAPAMKAASHWGGVSKNAAKGAIRGAGKIVGHASNFFS